MGWLVFGGAILVALLLGANWLVKADPKVLARTLKWAAVVVGSSLLGFLLLRGRAAVLAPLLIFAIPYIRRRLMAGLGSTQFNFSHRPSSGQSSDVETAYLKMSLDHDSGAIDGEVLRGTFCGRRLGSLNLTDLLALLGECGREDPESSPLLEAYLDRAHPDWRDEAELEGGRQGVPPRKGEEPMMAEEAWGVLGLIPGASEKEIKVAHRRLMKKLHPDQGGSTYLATKINQAKDVLLGT